MNIVLHNTSVFDKQFNGMPIAHGVNCMGVMGAGFALKIKERFPSHYQEYRAACQAGKLRPGQCLVTAGQQDAVTHADNLYIYHLAIKDHWSTPARDQWLRSAVRELADAMSINGHNNVVMPAIGTGLGGLDLESSLGSLHHTHSNVTVHVCIPGQALKEAQWVMKLLLNGS